MSSVQAALTQRFWLETVMHLKPLIHWLSLSQVSKQAIRLGDAEGLGEAPGEADGAGDGDPFWTRLASAQQLFSDPTNVLHDA